MALLVATGMASSSSACLATPTPTGLTRTPFTAAHPHPSPGKLALGSSRKSGGCNVTCASSSSPPSSSSTEPKVDWMRSGAVSIGAAAMLLLSPPLALADESEGGADVAPFQTYYGTAASASSYGGYGGNANKKDSAEYIFDVPQGWKERQISKVEKGTNGTDAEFYNPRKKQEKVYLTYLSGFRQLGPRDNVLSNLALSDVELQDFLGSAEDVKSDNLTQDGRLYYIYEIVSPSGHELIKVTCAKNKLYSHFVKAPASDWARDKDMLRKVHDSFTTVGDPTPVS